MFCRSLFLHMDFPLLMRQTGKDAYAFFNGSMAAADR